MGNNMNSFASENATASDHYSGDVLVPYYGKQHQYKCASAENYEKASHMDQEGKVNSL